MPLLRTFRKRGPGFDVLERVAAAQRARLEESSMLEGGAVEAGLRFGRQRLRWATDGKQHYLSLYTPKVAANLDVGRPGHLPYAKKMVAHVGVPVYSYDTRDGALRHIIEATERWLADPANVVLLERLRLTPGEWASFAANWTIVSLSADGDGDLDRVETVIQIVDAVTDPGASWLREPAVKASALPPKLRDLLPMIRKWAIDDDAVRSDRMARARTSTILTLWETVGPRLPEIDSFLDDEGASDAEVKSKIGRLGEATAEARLELENRGVDLRLGD